ncbi:endoglucanase Acf2 [Kineococcus xinjiangensis]|uniref:glucan endo-1,3-beta-D-glucosidase n=1 Tax=Kineococcus xinjiangensis TaxID=512762 RepID=A0A2S6IVC8_9ACTN|nr:glycosyl hydrolase [Kineococcus xinjiangensis]PPK98317.1 endoglucanase Acf2 [Kineococcus xinjiangensis]
MSLTRTVAWHRAAHRTAFAALALSLGAAGLAAVPVSGASAATVGRGSYADTLPADASGPTSTCGNLTSNPRQFVTANAPAGPVPTNDWWSSLLFKRTDCAYSQPLAAHPMSFDAVAGGLDVSYTTTPSITGTADGVSEFHYTHTTDLTVGVAGLNSRDTKVDGWSDWTVSPYWSDGTRTLRATIGHGLPFVYARVTGGNARIGLAGTPTVWSNNGSTVGFTVRGHDYVAFAPTGSAWNVGAGELTSGLGGKGYYSVAVLPTTAASTNADRVAALQRLAPYAHNHVTGTRVSWSYNGTNSTVRSTYSFTTQALEGSTTGTAVALYPHQWRHLSGTTAATPAYVSPRGQMRTLTGVTSFTTAMKYTGVLPELPPAGMSSADAATLNSYLDPFATGDPFAGFGPDTYWQGKALGRAARIAEIAHQVGRTDVRDHMVAAMKARLTDWFTASPGETQRLFAYEPNWKTLIGFPASYGSDQELNDHHFHYGYFVAAAATVAKFDPAWAASSGYGGMVDTVVRDANNYDRADARFPFLRDFDIYAGHDWASGHAGFGSGNNQESSSEGQNFAAGLIQFGEATGNTAMRDAGIFLWTTQTAAIHEYWFDSRNQNFPSAFGHDTVGMVWGDGASYSTWFTAEPEMIQGINMLPITGGSLYLGHNPAYIDRNIAELERVNGGPAQVWKDVIWSFQALSRPDLALTAFRRDPGYTPEEGESKAHTFHWIRSLNALGRVDISVTADTPLYAVFNNAGKRTYVASNPTATTRTVTFSDGTKLTVEPRRTATTSGGTGGFVARSTIQAEAATAQSGTGREATTDTGGGENVAWIGNGDWLRFDAVDFGTTAPTTVNLRVASGAAAGISGTVEVRLDSTTGPLLGSASVANTGGWQSWRTVPASVSGVTGKRTVYVNFRSGQPADFVNLNWLSFSG